MHFPLNDPFWLIAMPAAYLIGSIPFGLLIGFIHGIDIREHGSKNIGATNCARVIGTWWGLLCFALDVCKGLLPVIVVGSWYNWNTGQIITASESGCWLAVGVMAMVGHILPVWLRFRGGKGVATGLGVVFGVWPFLTLPAIATICIWLIVASALRYVSLASVVATMTLPWWFILTAATHDWPMNNVWPFVAVTAVMALLILIRHIGNIIRICRDTEPRIGQ